jgi:hypothetical protein
LNLSFSDIMIARGELVFMTDRIRLGISTCLLGEQVRYDGGHKWDRFITDTLGKYVEFVPVCPEVECGLGIPREAMHLVGDPNNPRLVTVRSGVDHPGFWSWKRRGSAVLSSRATRPRAAWNGSRSTAPPALP